MTYKMPFRSMEPLSDWNGELYLFVHYAFERIEDSWKWDNPAEARKIQNALTREQLALWAVANADGQVSNGGFSQLFFNSYGELAEEALTGFKMFGMQECADIFAAAYAEFPERPIPKDRKQRNTILTAMAESDIAYDAGASMADHLEVYAATKGASRRWDALESKYFTFKGQGGVPGGYNAAFYAPLAKFIAAHPKKFFVSNGWKRWLGF